MTRPTMAELRRELELSQAEVTRTRADLAEATRQRDLFRAERQRFCDLLTAGVMEVAGASSKLLDAAQRLVQVAAELRSEAGALNRWIGQATAYRRSDLPATPRGNGSAG